MSQEKKKVEVWSDIDGYDGIYQVSNYGRVRSFKSREEKILTPMMCGKSRKSEHGYLKVHLFKNGKHKKHYVHRLVGLAFIPNPYNKKEINHINEIKEDNRVENLEWCTRKENLNHGDRNRKASETQLNNPKYSKPTLCVETGVIYPSLAEAHRKTGILKESLITCCNGRQKTAGGYHWKYV